jgi:AcrR family transcriptional regulator
VAYKIDKRIIRTRKLIRDSFCQLLEKKPASLISVTELCNLAGINRNTFYCHYQTTRDVLEEMENEVMVQIDDALGDTHSSIEAITMVCRILKDNQKICQLLLSINAESELFPKVLELSGIRTLKVMEQKNNPLTQEYQMMLSDFLIAGSNAVIQTYSKNGMKEAPEDIAELIMEICYHGSTKLSVDPSEKFRTR